MESFKTKIDCFSGRNIPQQQFSLSNSKFNDPFSLLRPKKKFGIKMYFFEITGTDHLIAKKDERRN
jgi:hypothetical protein